MDPTSRAVAVVALAGVCLAASPAAAQPEEGAARPGVFVDTVEVLVVNVDVVVTDKAGNPVTDLTQDDFEVFEDGKRVEVTNFLIVQEARSEEETRAEGGHLTPFEAPEDNPLHLALFIDNENLGIGNRNRVFRRLEGYLEKAAGLKSKILLASYDNGLRIRQRFTDDAGLIREQLDDMEKRFSGGAEKLMEQRLVTRAIEDVDLSQDVTVIESEAMAAYSDILNFAQRRRDRTRQMLTGLGHLTDALAGLPGRKALMVVSDGFESRPGQTLFSVWQGKFGNFDFARRVANAASAEQSSPELVMALQALNAQANTARISFYTMNAGGEGPSGGISADQGQFDPGAISTASGGMTTGASNAAFRIADEEYSLRHMAAETGGLSFVANDDVGRLVNRVTTDLENFYSLGYSPPRERDGKRHKIDVKVKREGLVVRSRGSYRDKTQDEHLTDLTLSALLLDKTDNPLGLQLERGDESKAKGGFAVPLMVKIPIANLALIPQEGARVGELSLMVIVQSHDGDLSPPRKLPIPIRIPEASYRDALGQVAGYRVSLLMRPGKQRIAVGLRDNLSSVSSTTNLDLTIGREARNGKGR